MFRIGGAPEMRYREMIVAGKVTMRRAVDATC